MMPARRSVQWRRIGLAAAVVVVICMLAGVGWIAWWVSDNLGAPGPGATGSGPCGPADSVNLHMVFADGHTVVACTHDRPACPNQTISGSGDGETFSVSQFELSNQLRSTSRRYILTLRFNAVLSAEAAEQTLTIDPKAFLPGPPGATPSSSTLSSALVDITPRDPYEDALVPATGSVTVSSTHGVARGQIDGTFSSGAPRSDRPAPTSSTPIPTQVTGTFACNR
jgi:hypothetical protein